MLFCFCFLKKLNLPPFLFFDLWMLKLQNGKGSTETLKRCLMPWSTPLKSHILDMTMKIFSFHNRYPCYGDEMGTSGSWNKPQIRTEMNNTLIALNTIYPSACNTVSDVETWHFNDRLWLNMVWIEWLSNFIAFKFSSGQIFLGISQKK